MASQEHIDYARLSLVLKRCGKDVVDALLMKTVSVLRPTNPPVDEWTLDHLLYENAATINTFLDDSKPEDKKKKRVLLPGLNKTTNLSSWDLQLVILVLKFICNLNKDQRLIYQDVLNIANIRNNISHQAEPSLKKDIYESYVDRLEGSYSRILKFVNDDEVKGRVFGQMELLKKETIGMDILVEMIDWNRETIAAFERLSAGQAEMMTVQTDILNRQTEILAHLEEIIPYIKQFVTMAEASAIKTPVARMELELKNCASSSKMTKQFTEAMEQNRNGHVSDDRTIAKMQDILNSIIGGNKKINKIKDECVAFYIQCDSLEALVSLFKHIISGELTKMFKSLENELRKTSGYERVELNAIVQETDFWQCMEDIVNQLEQIRSDTEAQRQPVDTGITDNPLSRIQLPINLNKSSTGEAVIGFNVKSRTAEEALELTESIRNGSKQHVLDNLTTFLRERFSVPNLELNLRLAEKPFDVSAGANAVSNTNADITKEVGSAEKDLETGDNGSDCQTTETKACFMIQALACIGPYTNAFLIGSRSPPIIPNFEF